MWYNNYVKKPNLRIKEVFEQVMENHGSGIGKAMLDHGYTKSSAKNPKNVTDSKSWEMLLDKYIPEDLVLETHREAFKANKVISARTMENANEKTDDFIDVPDWPTRTKAVELGYKVRGKLTERIDHTTGGKDLKGLIQINYVKEKDSSIEVADDGSSRSS